MTPRKEPAWLPEARALSAQGMRTYLIARKVGQHRCLVVYWLNLNGEQERKRELAKLRRSHRIRYDLKGSRGQLIEKHKPRKIPQPKYDWSALAQQLVAKEISRDTFSRMLRETA